MAQTLEQKARCAKARYALDMVTRHGVNGSPINGEDFRYGLKHEVFGQQDVDEAQLKYHKYKARRALGIVTRHGVDSSLVNGEDLKYGLKHGVFWKQDVDKAQRKYESTHKK